MPRTTRPVDVPPDGAEPLRPLRDHVAPGVQVLFVGINPGIRSARTGHHFAGYSNRFWTLLFEARLVPEPLAFADDDRLPAFGFGITNIVPRPTPGVADLTPAEFAAGRRRLGAKVRRWRPAVVALVGVTVYRALFPGRAGAVRFGRQAERFEGATVFVLPNPSGRNAHLSHAQMLDAFRRLRRHLQRIARAARADSGVIGGAGRSR